MTGWKEISQQQNLELSKELLERQGTINGLKAEVERLTAALAEAREVLAEADIRGDRWQQECNKLRKQRDDVEVHANAVQEENDRLHKLVDDLRQGDGHEVCRAELTEATLRAEQTQREDSADWSTTVRTMQDEISEATARAERSDARHLRASGEREEVHGKYLKLLLDWEKLREQRDLVEEHRDSLYVALSRMTNAAYGLNLAAIEGSRVIAVVNGVIADEPTAERAHRANAQAVIGRVVETLEDKLNPEREEVEARRLDAQLADVNRRVAADKAVIAAAKAWREWQPYGDKAFGPEIDLIAAVDALVEVEDTHQDRCGSCGNTRETIVPASAQHGDYKFVPCIECRPAEAATHRWLGHEPEDTPQPAAERLCGSCNGTRWVDDENWQPEDWEWARGRIPASGRIPCGICNEGGWSIPDIKPGVEATGARKHECSEVDNGFGGYLCTCGELWPVSFGGCSDLPKEQRAANKAAWDEGQKRRAEMFAQAAVDRDGEVER